MYTPHTCYRVYYVLHDLPGYMYVYSTPGTGESKSKIIVKKFCVCTYLFVMYTYMKNVCAARVVHNIQHTQHYCLCLLCMYRLCTLRVCTCSTWYVYYTHDRVVSGNNTGPVRTQLLSNTQTVLVQVVITTHLPHI